MYSHPDGTPFYYPGIISNEHVSTEESKMSDVFLRPDLISQELMNYRCWSEMQNAKLLDLEKKLKEAKNDNKKLYRKCDKLDDECRELYHHNKKLKNDCRYYLNRFHVIGEPTKTNGKNICNYHMMLGKCDLGNYCHRGKHPDMSILEIVDIINLSQKKNCRNEKDSTKLCNNYIVCPFKHSNTYEPINCDIRKENFRRIYNLADQQRKNIFT